MTGAPVSLTEAPVGRALTVVAIAGGDPARLARLSGLGIVPGARLRVHQRRPAFVIQADESYLALERDIAALIRVTPG